MTENLPFSIHQFDLAFPAHLNYVADPGSSEYGIKSWWPICYQDFSNSVCHYHWAEGWIPHSEWLNLTVIVSTGNPESHGHCNWTGHSLRWEILQCKYI